MENEVPMTTYIVYVHWCSDHVFTSSANARQGKREAVFGLDAL
jgi:hypothetical protein